MVNTVERVEVDLPRDSTNSTLSYTLKPEGGIHILECKKKEYNEKELKRLCSTSQTTFLQTDP